MRMPDFGRELARIQKEVNRIFEEVFRMGDGSEDNEEGKSWYPGYDLYEDDENFIVYMDLPGVNPADVELIVREDTLTLRGRRETKASGKCHRRERNYGEFFRAIRLPQPVEEDGVHASYKDGVLEVVLPKSSQQGKHIEIQAE